MEESQKTITGMYKQGARTSAQLTIMPSILKIMTRDGDGGKICVWVYEWVVVRVWIVVVVVVTTSSVNSDDMERRDFLNIIQG